MPSSYKLLCCIIYLTARALSHNVDEDRLFDAGDGLGEGQPHHCVDVSASLAGLATPG